MTRRMNHAGWVALNVGGLTGAWLLELWVPYWAAFAVVEALGLWLDWPFTLTVRSFVHPRRGPLWQLRHTVVLAWSIVFVGTWWAYAPLPIIVSGPIGLAFYIWFARHIFDGRHYTEREYAG